MSLVQGSFAKDGKTRCTGLVLRNEVDTANEDISSLDTRYFGGRGILCLNSYQERNERESWDRPDGLLERAFRCGSHVGSACIRFEMRETSRLNSAN